METSQELFDAVVSELRARLGKFSEHLFVSTESSVYAEIESLTRDPFTQKPRRPQEEDWHIGVIAKDSGGKNVHFATSHHRTARKALEAFIKDEVPKLQDHFGLSNTEKFDPILMGA